MTEQIDTFTSLYERDSIHTMYTIHKLKDAGRSSGNRFYYLVNCKNIGPTHTRVCRQDNITNKIC